MKKSKVLIATLALSAALMGTGYAYWTQAITTTATVNTANFNVKFETIKESKDVIKKVYEGIESETASTTPYDGNSKSADLPSASDAPDQIKDTVIKAKNGKMTFTTKNLFPGTEVVAKVKVINESTIPVYGIPDKMALGDIPVKDIKCEIFDKDPSAEDAKAYDANYPITLKEAGSTDGASKDVWVKISMLSTVGRDNNGNKHVNKKIKGDIKINWHQFNEEIPTSPNPTDSPNPTESPAPTEEPAQ